MDLKRKKISLGLQAWEEAQKVRKKEGVSWDWLIYRAIGVSREVGLRKELRELWERHKRTERFQRSLFHPGELEASLFFLKPEVKRLLLEAGKKQRCSPSELLEILVSEKFGAEGEESSEEAEAPIAVPKQKDAPQRKKLEATVVLGGRSLDLVPVSEDREKDSDLSAAEKRWLRKRAGWVKEAQRWEWKPSMTLVWPERAKGRVLWEEEAIRDGVVRKVRTFFIYYLESREDLSFLRPYRMDFYIERESKSEISRIEPEAHKTISFQFEKHTEMKAKLKEKAAIFEKLEKGEIGDQIG